MYCLVNSGIEFTGSVNIGNPGEFIKLTNSYSQIIFKPLSQDNLIQRKLIIEFR